MALPWATNQLAGPATETRLPREFNWQITANNPNIGTHRPPHADLDVGIAKNYDGEINCSTLQVSMNVVQNRLVDKQVSNEGADEGGGVPWGEEEATSSSLSNNIVFVVNWGLKVSEWDGELLVRIVDGKSDDPWGRGGGGREINELKWVES